MVYMRQVGARVKRKEDPRLITGTSTYVDDLQPAGLCHLAVVRSVYAHAKINGVDISAAAALPGVVAVLTGKDFRDMLEPMPHGGEGGGMPGMQAIATPVVAEDRVVHVGQAVAVVVAQDRYTAQDGADLVQVDYEPLDAITDIEEAIKDGAPQIYANVPNNIAYTWTRKKGDADAAFAAAEVTVTQRMNNQRVAGVPMEGRAVLAQPDPLSGGLTVYTSIQNPHTARSQIAQTLRLPEIAVRVVAPEVGGGFGVKISTYPEDMMVASTALRLQRPVKWIETRSESMLATHHGRAQFAELSLAARRDGTITALKMRLLADLGGYPRDPGIPPLTGLLINGVYQYDTLDVEIRTVYTNTMATGAYRGAGRPEAAYYVERIMDVLADELKMDPAEVRRKNFIPPDAFPHKTAAGPTYDSGEYDKALTKALELAGYEEMRAQQAEARKAGRLVGIGLTSFCEICGFGPFDSATVRVEPSGSVTVLTGISPHGQGQETTFSQIVADALGVPMEDIVVVHGDTARTPQGIGTMGSRGLVVGGSALVRSIGKVQEKAKKIAAHLLEASPEDIEYADGKWGVKGAPDRSKTFKEIAKAAYSGSMPDAIGTGLEETDFFRPPDTTFPFGADVVQVEINPDTGEVALQRYVTVDDCGRVISPLLVDGQVHGGLTQGIGQALWEEVVYDESGQLVTGSLMDYAVPKAEFLPWFENDRTETPTPRNPLGAKGIGELATIGSTPAVVNAVVDALSPLGVRHVDMPLKPERLWHIIQDAKGQQRQAAD
ncbi:MAG TPA: xanthine dehydrogenase family protein molybdopterin-binding subunit [Thermomicrobiales bacterium]|nr:xanthine dehydrogenase family protein molybdopterin-binding subunit [Thermomicrobiales bacterium]